MDIEHSAITEYWSRHEDECGLSVDWAEAEKLCWRCAQGRKLQRCHIIPRGLGGTEEPSNLVLLCAQCHAEAPNVADASFMWTWLRAHAAPFYGNYWNSRGFREYEFIFGEKPFRKVENSEIFMSSLQTAVEIYMKQVSTHWGQGKLNPATLAWIVRQVENSARE